MLEICVNRLEVAPRVAQEWLVTWTGGNVSARDSGPAMWLSSHRSAL